MAQRKARPAFTPEARENQMIAYAVDLAEQQLRDGTASSQVITHYLKLGSTREKAEKKNIELKNELLKAQTESIKSGKNIENLFKEAMNAFKGYSGQDDSNNEGDEYEDSDI